VEDDGQGECKNEKEIESSSSSVASAVRKTHVRFLLSFCFLQASKDFYLGQAIDLKNAFDARYPAYKYVVSSSLSGPFRIRRVVFFEG